MKGAITYAGIVALATGVAFVAGTRVGDRGRDEALPRSAPDAAKPAPVSALLPARPSSPPAEVESQWLAVEDALEKLAEKDAAAALDELESLTMPAGVRAKMRGKIFARWAAADPAAAAAAAQATGDAMQRVGAIKGVAAGWAGGDPEAALHWAAGLEPKDSTRIGAIAAALLSAAEHGATDAVELALTLSTSDLVKLGEDAPWGWPPLVNILRTVGDSDPAAGFALLEQLPVEAIVSMVKSHVPGVFTSPFSEMSAAEPQLALLLAERLTPGSQAHAILLTDALRGLAKTDPERAVELASALLLKAQKFAIDRALEHLGKSDPAAAAALAIRQTQFEAHIAYGIMEQNLARLARRDAAGAEQALALLEETSVYGASLRASVIANMAQHDPVRALAQLGRSEDDIKARYRIANTWAKNDTAAFREWLTTADEQMQHFGRVALARLDLKNDLEAVAEVMAEEAHYAFDRSVAWQVADIIEDITVAKADLDFEEAVSWLSDLGDSPLAKRAAGKLAKLSLSFDSVDSSAWIASLPPGPSRDAAAKVLVDHLRERDPGAAYRWAIAIDDPKERDYSLRFSASAYFQKDAAGAVGAIRELEAGELRDASIRAISSEFAAADAPGAFALAQLITDNDSRTSNMSEALVRAGDVPARRGMVEALPDSDPARAPLLKQIERWENPPSLRFGPGFQIQF